MSSPIMYSSIGGEVKWPVQNRLFECKLSIAWYLWLWVTKETSKGSFCTPWMPVTVFALVLRRSESPPEFSYVKRFRGPA